MERFPRTNDEAEKLLKLADLLRESALTVIEEWKKEDFSLAKSGTGNAFGSQDTAAILPSPALHQAQRTILAATGAISELVVEPYARIQEVGCQYFESRALFIAAERRIPDLLAEAGNDGLDVSTISEKTGIEVAKLGRILRVLCSIHIFREAENGRFINNRISKALVHNEPLRAYVQVFNLDVYTASDHLPKQLLSRQGDSYDVCVTPFQNAVSTTKSRWDWLSEKVFGNELVSGNGSYPGVPDISNFNLVLDKDGMVTRPELENFGRAMVGGGQLYGAAHAFDYPWAELGEALVVDVGGGVGGFVRQLLPSYPKLKFVVQDRPEVIRQAREEFWPKQDPASLKSGRVTLVEHDFFNDNPIQGADIYWLRGVLHDWSDSYFIQILKAIRTSMSPKSRILICDLVMNTTCGFPGMKSAPSPLPANYGYFGRYAHHRDLGLMTVINGIERTPSEFEKLIEEAGLKIIKILETRSLNSIVEVGL